MHFIVECPTRNIKAKSASLLKLLRLFHISGSFDQHTQSDIHRLRIWKHSTHIRVETDNVYVSGERGIRCTHTIREIVFFAHVINFCFRSGLRHISSIP